MGSLGKRLESVKGSHTVREQAPRHSPPLHSVGRKLLGMRPVRGEVRREADRVTGP